ncbi:MAG: DNA-processing protein DprA [Clostridia bacterium]|nr:DNA-processing protein DprA [Clostridia bacterium]
MVYRLREEGALTGCAVRDVSSVDSSMIERARALLSRADDVACAIEAYRRQGYVILTQQDECWPKRLNRLPTGQRPHVLFAKGNLSLLSGRKVAVAGSRDILPHTASMARRAGQALAAEGLIMVSGGARGVDTAAHSGTLELGGNLILVPAKPVQQLTACPEIEKALQDDRLLILCDAPPDERFSAPKAIARNHTIYALGEAALVIASRDGVGGSWHGATDCLRGGYTPLYVAEGSNDDMLGNAALHRLGAGQIDLLKPLRSQLFASQQLSCLEQFS